MIFCALNVLIDWKLKKRQTAKVFDKVCHSVSASLFPVYGFQNNLAPTSIGALTTSGGNVTANLGGNGCLSVEYQMSTRQQ